METENFSQDAMGYFGPESITWQIYREPLSVLGGMRALLLQIAHPAVAQGVAQYSSFQSDPFGRGFRTFVAMANIYFGDKQQADKTGQRLQRLHAGIKGHYPVFHQEEPLTEISFSANEPSLLFWVLATLTDTTLQVYERMPNPDLPPDWRECFYEESKIAAHLLGIPKGEYPVDLQAFNLYFAEILHGDLLGSTPACRAMAQAIVRHPKIPGKWADLLAAGWLPAPLCGRMGIVVHPDASKKLEKLLRRIGRVYRFLPRTLRYNPAYHQACYRIARATDKTPTLAGRFFYWFGRWTKFPLGL